MSTLIGYRQKGFVLASLSAATWLLSACGGSGTSTPATPAVPTLQGLAATGLALPGASVTAKCSTGAPIVGTTAADGSFSLSLSGGQTAPCLLQVVGGTPSVTLHGFATQAGRVNLTPLSDLVVSKALGSDPALAFASYDAAKGNVISAGLAAAKTYVNTQAAAITGSTPAVDVLTGTFKVGDAEDVILDRIGLATRNAGKTLADLRTGAAAGTSLTGIVAALPATPASPASPASSPAASASSPAASTPATPASTPAASGTTAAGNECAPLTPKAGDSLTYSANMLPTISNYTMRYDYSSSTFQGQPALALTTTSTIAGTTGTSVTYTSPTTGAYLGSNAAAATTTTVTTFDPPDYQDRINNAAYNIGQVATVAVKARITGSGITNSFAAIGGGTALTMDYSFTVERKPNESLTVPAGTFANVCKLQINVTINNVKLEGNNGSNPLYSSLFGSLSSAFAQPYNTTVWLTNKLPNVPKYYMTTAAAGGGSSTQELTSYTLAPR